MRKYPGAMSIFLGILMAAGTLWADGIKDGQWKMTVVTKMAGMEEQMAEARKQMENMPPEQKAMMEQMMGKMNVSFDAGSEGMTTTITQCISGDNPVPEMETTQQECTVTHSVEGNTVSFEAVCPQSSSSGEMTYDDDSMKGTITSQQTVDGQPTEATMTISGEYLGPCE